MSDLFKVTGIPLATMMALLRETIPTNTACGRTTFETLKCSSPTHTFHFSKIFPKNSYFLVLQRIFSLSRKSYPHTLLSLHEDSRTCRPSLPLTPREGFRRRGPSGFPSFLLREKSATKWSIRIPLLLTPRGRFLSDDAVHSTLHISPILTKFPKIFSYRSK